MKKTSILFLAFFLASCGEGRVLTPTAQHEEVAEAIARGDNSFVINDGGTPVEQFVSPEKLAETLSKIPVTDKKSNAKNLLERLNTIGMPAISVIVSHIENKNDVETVNDKIGDTSFEITAENRKTQIIENSCILTTTFNVLSRNGKFYPQDKTTNYLMTGICKIPTIK